MKKATPGRYNVPKFVQTKQNDVKTKCFFVMASYHFKD